MNASFWASGSLQFICITILLCTMGISQGNASTFTKFTNPSSVHYRISMNSFFDRYSGKSERNDLLLKYFRKKRKAGGDLMITTTALSIPLNFIGDPTTFNLVESYNSSRRSYTVVTVSPIGVGLSIGFFTGWGKLGMYSKKRLYQYLNGVPMAPLVEEKFLRYQQVMNQ